MIWPAYCTVCSTVLNSALRRAAVARARLRKVALVEELDGGDEEGEGLPAARARLFLYIKSYHVISYQVLDGACARLPLD